jgi:hypothetical protein
MSSPPEFENGAYGANGATGAHDASAGVGPRVVPNVYYPPVESTPPYEEYVDPAVAHGWQNAYDETSQLPLVPETGEPPTVPGGEPVAARPAGPGRRSRRKPSRWRSRRVVVAAGAAGAVSVAALIAGFSFSGSTSGGTEGKEGGTRSAPDESTGPAGSSSSGGPGSSGAQDAAGSDGTESDGADASKGASPDESGEPSATPSTDPTDTTTPTSTASASGGSAPGNSDGKGRGPGATKKPR